MKNELTKSNMVQAMIGFLHGESVEINRDTHNGYKQEFSDELSVVITDKELILDNLYELNGEEDVVSAMPIHILQERILEVEENFSGDVEILTLDGLITISE